MKVFFNLACMSTCCLGLPKPKYEPFITHNRGTLIDFFRAPFALTAWQQLCLFSKAAQHGPAPFVACFRGLCKFQGL